ncbi:hypothetical protein DFH29DRAFT_912284, partial [Suillus ampliporus]
MHSRFNCCFLLLEFRCFLPGMLCIILSTPASTAERRRLCGVSTPFFRYHSIMFCFVVCRLALSQV